MVEVYGKRISGNQSFFSWGRMVRRGKAESGGKIPLCLRSADCLTLFVSHGFLSIRQGQMPYAPAQSIKSDSKFMLCQPSSSSILLRVIVSIPRSFRGSQISFTCLDGDHAASTT